MADKKNAFLITLAISLSVTVGVAVAASTGIISNFFTVPEGETVFFNGTLLGKDNKNYSVLISTTDTNPNLTSINSAVLDSNNKTWHIQIAPKVITPVPEPEPEPPVCPEGQLYNTTSKQCQAVPTPVPEPTPTPTPAVTKKVILVGDVDNTNAGNSVLNQIKSRNPAVVAALGDLGYDSNLAWFKSSYGVTFGNKLVCVPGNHDSSEDGSSSIASETRAFCSNPFYFKLNKVLFIGADTNGDMTKQATSIGARINEKAFMQGITSVHIMTHKGCAVPPNSHHPVESNVKVFCDAIKAKIPTGLKVYFDSAHNHVLSESADQIYKQSGAGGRSHYTCETDTVFPFCNNSNYGFLEYTIKPDGTTTRQFIDYNGKVLRG